jgi:hypothetical protein
MGVINHRFVLLTVLVLLTSRTIGADDALATYRQRTLTALQLLCEGFSETAARAAFPGISLDSAEDIARGATVFGWRRRIDFADGSHANVERIAPGGQLRRLSVEYSDRRSRPLLLVLAAPDCAIRNARSIEYDADYAVYLNQLDGQLNPQGERIPMNPPPPAGEDAQGTTVALIDSGVNYLLPGIARHLARDAQGRSLGFDFWDMDPRPFDAHPVRSPFFPQRHGTRSASIIVREAPETRLIPYRYPRPDMQRMRELITQAADAGARVVNLSLGGNKPDQWNTFEQVARQHPGMLFVVSAGNNGRDIDERPVYPASLNLDNMLTVTSADTDGYPASGSNWGRSSVDLLVPGEQIPAFDFSGTPRDVSGSSYAAARVAALASRILLNSPELSVPALRRTILSMAQPAPGPFVSEGWIIEPADLARERDAQSLRVSADTVWPGGAASGDRYRPTLVMINDSGWDRNEVRQLVQHSANILKQCGIVLLPAKMLEVTAADGVRDFSRSNAKLLTEKVGTEGPRVFFVRDTLDRPAFDAVTFGTANSRSNPDLRFTVWMTAATRDPHIALAHELAHTLLDDGSHTGLPGNLMRSDTSPDNVELNEQQCSMMRNTARENGLLG